MSRTRPETVAAKAPQVRIEQPSAGKDLGVQTNPHGVTDPSGSHARPAARTIRHAHLYLTRIDPWSVMKNAFMLSIAIAIVLIVATMILWVMLTVSGTLAALTRTADDIAGQGANAIDLTGLFSFGRVLVTVSAVAVMEVILVSALATLFAYLYNLAVGITGGLQVTLTEDN